MKNTTRRLLAVLLVFAVLHLPAQETSRVINIAGPAQKSKPDNVVLVCVVSAAIIVVGTIMTIKLIHVCKQVLPPPQTNTYSPTDNDSAISFAPAGAPYTAAIAPDTNVLAAWFTLGPDPATNLASAVCVVLSSGIILSTNGFVPLLSSPVRANATMTVPQYMSALKTLYGLNPGPAYEAIGSAAFTVNGQPVASVPGISWDWAKGTLNVTNGNPSCTAIYEKENNLAGPWTPFLTNTISAGMTVRIEDDDATANEAFYRVVIATNAP